MGMGIWQYAPNRIITHWISTSGYNVLARNVATNAVTGYGTIAALHAAGAGILEWPNLDTYTNLQYIGLRSVTGAGADGGGFYFVFDKAIIPASDNDSEFVSGGGQFLLLPGPLHNIWVKPVTAGDHIILLGGF